jgi:hypothetical protein
MITKKAAKLNGGLHLACREMGTNEFNAGLNAARSPGYNEVTNFMILKGANSVNMCLLKHKNE